MKKLLLAFFTLLGISQGYAQTTILLEDFEGGTSQYSTANTQDSWSNYFILMWSSKTDGGTSYSNNQYFVNSGRYFAGYDNDERQGSVTFNGVFDISDFDKIEINTKWAAAYSGSANWYYDSDAKVQYRIDGGAWTNALWFNTNGGTSDPMVERSGVGGTINNGNFQNFKRVLNNVDNSTIEIRVLLTMDFSARALGFDDILVEGFCTQSAPAISESDFEFCPGTEFTLNAQSNPSGQYQWYKDGVILPDETNQSLISNEAGSYTVAFPDQVCNEVSNPVVATEFAPQPKPNVYPGTDQFICADGAFTFDTDAGDGYQWLFNGSAIGVGGNSKTYDATQSGAYSVIVTNSDGCADTSDVVNLLLYPEPDQPVISSTGADDGMFGHCEGNVFDLVSTDAAGGYQWKYQGANVSGGTNKTLEIIGDGVYSVITTDANGCTSESEPVTVSTLANPAIPEIQANGPLEFCEGDQVRLTSSQTANAYQWYKDDVAIGGATGKIFIATETGGYEVEITNQFGCSSISDKTFVTVNPNPAKASIQTSGPTSFCPGGDVDLSVSESATNYKWYKDGVKVAEGATTNSYTANTSGDYHVVLINEHGCSTNSDTVTVTVYFEDPASISADGDTEFCAGGEVTLSSNYDQGNQWYRNGVAIAGVVTQDFVATQSGDYYVVVTIGGCSDQSNTITVTVNDNPNKPVIDQGDTVICNGASVELRSDIANGLQWYKDDVAITGATFQTLEVSSTGLYYVVTTNGSGCSDTSETVEVIVNFEQEPSITPNDVVICEGDEVTLVSSEVLGNQWYRNDVLIPNATNQSYVTSQAGTYRVQVNRDGCSVSSSNAIVQVRPVPDQPEITAEGSTSFCRGDSVRLTSSTYGNYQWYKDGVAIGGATLQSYVATEEGDYTVVHVNEFDCPSESEAVVVSFFNSPRMSGVFTNDASCNGLDDGSLTANSTGGVAPVEYALSESGPYQTDNEFTGLSAGDYMVYVRDANGCTDSLEATINNSNTSLVVSVVKDNDISCYNFNDGQLTATASGGAGNYTYSIDNGLNTQPDGVFSGLSEGCYVVRVEDNGCISYSDTVCIVNPEKLEVVANLDNDISCHDDNNAQITAFGGGGTPPYQYSLNGNPYQNDDFFAFLGSGTYTVTILDANGCTAVSDPVVVTNPEELAFSFITKDEDVLCFGEASGQITVSVTGGTKPYEYRAGTFPYSNDSVLRNLPAGFYTISVLDAHNCELVSGVDTVEITEPPRLMGTIEVDTNVACFGEETGGITIHASGGTPPIEYSINGGQDFQADSVFTDLAAKAYEVILRDANDCEVSIGSVNITQPPLYEVVAEVAQKVSCNGSCDARIEASVTGGTGPVLVRLNEGPWGTDTSWSNLCPGTYVVSTMDSIGCVKESAELVIADPPLLTIGVNKQDISCFGACDGRIVVTANGGTGLREYSLDNINFQNGTAFEGLCAGQYVVYAQDAKGCDTISDTIEIVEPEELIVTGEIVQNVSCFGANDGVYSSEASGGVGNYLYTLNGVDFQTGGTFSNLAPGTYKVKVFDFNNCEAETESFTILEPAPVVINTVNRNHITCNGKKNGSFVIFASGGIGALQYSINGGQSYQSSNTFNNLGPNTYSIVVKDSKGCLSPVRTDSITEPEAISFTVDIDQHVLCNGGTDGQFTVNATGGTGTLQYSLDGFNYQFSPTFMNLRADVYRIAVKDANQCLKTLEGIEITEPAEVTAVLTEIVPLNCSDDNNGKLRVNASGGNGVYEYRLNEDPNWISGTTDFVISSAGTYYVTVRDSNGCEGESEPIEVVAPPKLLIATYQVSPVSCFGSEDGVIRVQGQGGVGSYLYNVNGGAFQSDSIFDGLGSGEHVVNLVDENGCSVSDTIELTEPGTFNLSGTTICNTSNSMPNGGVDIEVNNVVPPVSYQWSNGAKTQDLENVREGSYTVEVTDGNGCSRVQNFTVGNCIGVEEQSAGTWKVYPNPVSSGNGLTLSFAGSWSGKTITLRLVDVLGQVVSQRELTVNAGNLEAQLSTDGLAKGAYLVVIESEGERQVQSLMIQ